MSFRVNLLLEDKELIGIWQPVHCPVNLVLCPLPPPPPPMISCSHAASGLTDTVSFASTPVHQLSSLVKEGSSRSMKDLLTYGFGTGREMHSYGHAVSKAEFIDTFRTTRQLLAREKGSNCVD